jgi:hypothetical protein
MAVKLFVKVNIFCLLNFSCQSNAYQVSNEVPVCKALVKNQMYNAFFIFPSSFGKKFPGQGKRRRKFAQFHKGIVVF